MTDPSEAPDLVERVARAIHSAKMTGHNPDCLYEHHEHEKWPVDDRREYRDAFTDELRVQLFHKAWRHYEEAARAALAAIPSQAGEVERLRAAATELLAAKFSTYRARNGREVGVEADDGEKCWIVHIDQIAALEAALSPSAMETGPTALEYLQMEHEQLQALCEQQSAQLATHRALGHSEAVAEITRGRLA